MIQIMKNSSDLFKMKIFIEKELSETHKIEDILFISDI